MDTKNISRWERKLTVEREELLATLQRLSDETRQTDADETKDVGDVCLSTLTKESLFQQRSQAQGRLRMIEMALTRIEEGSFGTCMLCGEEIKARRLEALPWASNCIHCQEQLEQQREGEVQTPSFSVFSRVAV